MAPFFISDPPDAIPIVKPPPELQWLCSNLASCIKKGDTNGILSCLVQGADLNWTAPDGFYPLWVSAIVDLNERYIRSEMEGARDAAKDYRQVARVITSRARLSDPDPVFPTLALYQKTASDLRNTAIAEDLMLQAIIETRGEARWDLDQILATIGDGVNPFCAERIRACCTISAIHKNIVRRIIGSRDKDRLALTAYTLLQENEGNRFYWTEQSSLPPLEACPMPTLIFVNTLGKANRLSEEAGRISSKIDDLENFRVETNDDPPGQPQDSDLVALFGLAPFLGLPLSKTHRDDLGRELGFTLMNLRAMVKKGRHCHRPASGTQQGGMSATP